MKSYRVKLFGVNLCIEASDSVEAWRLLRDTVLELRVTEFARVQAVERIASEFPPDHTGHRYDAAREE